MKLRTITTPQLPNHTWLARTIAVLLAASALAIAPHAQARVFISVNIAPPLLPIYEQPPIPGSGYYWTPGYWAYDRYDGYFWVPGTWVRTPYYGALWTPAYWGWGGNAYVFYPGYWGRSVGYYGGIDYGYGYTGSGYYGGYWGNGGFYYNTAYNQFGSVRITNVYTKTVVDSVSTNRFSYNGPGGVSRQPTAVELANSRERHTGMVSEQIRQQTLASRNTSLRASVNHGTPSIMATPRAGVFERASAGAAAVGRSNRVEQSTAAHAGSLRSANYAPRHGQGSMHGTAMQPMHASRTTTTHMHQASSDNRSIERHYQSTSHVNGNERSTSNGSSGPSMRQERQSQHYQGQREASAMHSSEGPRHGNSTRTETPRQAPAQRGGGEKQQSGGDKPKDRNHGGG
jgi:hypothetical protein